MGLWSNWRMKCVILYYKQLRNERMWFPLSAKLVRASQIKRQVGVCCSDEMQLNTANVHNGRPTTEKAATVPDRAQLHRGIILSNKWPPTAKRDKNNHKCAGSKGSKIHHRVNKIHITISTKNTADFHAKQKKRANKQNQSIVVV